MLHLELESKFIFSLFFQPQPFIEVITGKKWPGQQRQRGKKNPFPKQRELSAYWVKRMDFPVIQKTDIISPFSSHSQSSENIHFFLQLLTVERLVTY